METKKRVYRKFAQVHIKCKVNISVLFRRYYLFFFGRQYCFNAFFKMAVNYAFYQKFRKQVTKLRGRVGNLTFFMAFV